MNFQRNAKRWSAQNRIIYASGGKGYGSDFFKFKMSLLILLSTLGVKKNYFYYIVPISIFLCCLVLIEFPCTFSLSSHIKGNLCNKAAPASAPATTIKCIQTIIIQLKR